MRRAVLLLVPLLLLVVVPAEPVEPDVPPLRVLRTGGLRVETAALLLSGQQGGTIPIAVLAVPLPGASGAGDRARVAVLMEIDGAEAMEGWQGGLLLLEICLYAVSAPAEGAGGRVAGSRMDTVEIDLARLGEDVERSGIKYAGEIAVPPGDYALRALVRNAATGEVGLRSLPLSVPDFGRAERLLLPPLLAEPADAWVVARGAGPTGTTALPSPLSLDALPSARPVLAPAERVTLRLPAWKLGDGELRAEVRRPGGARVASFPLAVAERQATGVQGLEVVTASFDLKDVEEGVYEVRAVAGGEADKPEESPAAVPFATPFVLLAKGGGGQVWAALTPARRGAGALGDRSEPAPASRPAAPPRGKKTRKIDAEPVRTAYRGALERVARGDRDGGRQAVLEMEAATLTGERPASSDDLMEVELSVAQEVSKGEAGALLPLAVLHQAIYRDTVRRQSFLLSTHNREMAFRLADLYARRDGSPEGRRQAARILAALGDEMILTSPPGLRSRLFRQILAYDENDETALLCLAVDAERQGRYAEAAGFLERLLRVYPTGAMGEARLRLGVNLARIGKLQEARKALAEVADSAGTEPWEVAVAWQELGRLRLAAGDLEGAETVVRDGLKRLPDDDKLALELALIRDLRKDPRAAREALGNRARGARGSGGAARERYNQMPLPALKAAWEALQRTAGERAPALAAALGVPAGAEAPRNTP